MIVTHPPYSQKKTRISVDKINQTEIRENKLVFLHESALIQFIYESIVCTHSTINKNIEVSSIQ